MPNVVRFTLPSARDLAIRGAGQFVDGVLDVDANDLRLVSRTRYLVKPYGAVEVGIVDSTTPKPSLPAVPAEPIPDPYPQYPTMDEIVASPAARAASVVAVEGATAVNPAGAWDFDMAPTVNGSPLGTGGGGDGVDLAQIVAVSSVAYAATITPAVSGRLLNVVNVGTLTGATTVANPTGTKVDGMKLELRLQQDATGERAITWGTDFAFGSDLTAAMLPDAPSSKYVVLFGWDTGSSKWRALGLSRGF